MDEYLVELKKAQMVMYELRLAGFSVEKIARLFGFTSTYIQHLLEREARRRRR